MATKEKPIKVVFRKYKNAEVIALFPEIPWNTHNYTTTSYITPNLRKGGIVLLGRILNKII